MTTQHTLDLLRGTVNLDRQSWIGYDAGLEPEQLECIADPERTAECLEMLGDMEARMHLDVAELRAAIRARLADASGVELIQRDA